MVDVSEGSLGMSGGHRLPERRSLYDEGLVTQYVLFFIDIASRSVHVAGNTPHPDNSWMTQIARNIADADDGFLRGTRYLIL
jgi:putative transposase